MWLKVDHSPYLINIECLRSIEIPNSTCHNIWNIQATDMEGNILILGIYDSKELAINCLTALGKVLDSKGLLEEING